MLLEVRDRKYSFLEFGTNKRSFCNYNLCGYHFLKERKVPMKM